MESFSLEQREVAAIYDCPIDSLIDMHENKTYFTASGVDATGQHLQTDINQAILPYNWDNYHYKVALLARRYLAGESNLIY